LSLPASAFETPARPEITILFERERTKSRGNTKKLRAAGFCPRRPRSIEFAKLFRFRTRPQRPPGFTRSGAFERIAKLSPVRRRHQSVRFYPPCCVRAASPSLRFRNQPVPRNSVLPGSLRSNRPRSQPPGSVCRQPVLPACLPPPPGSVPFGFSRKGSSPVLPALRFWLLPRSSHSAHGVARTPVLPGTPQPASEASFSIQFSW